MWKFHGRVIIVYNPRYSAKKTTSTLVRFSTVSLWILSALSSTVCRYDGKGVGIMCSTGTPAIGQKVQVNNQLFYAQEGAKCLKAKPLIFTLPKERHIVIIYQTHSYILSEVCLLTGVGRQQAQIMQSLFFDRIRDSVHLEWNNNFIH